MENLLKRTINDLVTESHIRASVLYYFGVKFYDYKTETLEDVCSRHGLRAESVMKAMELVSDNNGTTKKQLQSFPVELMVEYLKHAHYLFVKKRIPYIAQLIDGLQIVNFRYQSLSADLKSVFPLFVEDFIEHIYIPSKICQDLELTENEETIITILKETPVKATELKIKPSPVKASFSILILFLVL